MELMLQRLAISSRRGLESGLRIIPHVQQIVPRGKLREVVFKECNGFKVVACKQLLNVNQKERRDTHKRLLTNKPAGKNGAK